MQTKRKKLEMVPKAKIQASFSGPAVYSNCMLASDVGTGLRLTFMEQGTEPQFRVAVFLDYSMAASLRDFLIRRLVGGKDGLKKK